jgi:hypothetical protein
MPHSLAPYHPFPILLFNPTHPLFSASPTPLKVHKIEILFGFDFEICNISLLVMSKYQDFAKRIFGLGQYWGRYDFSA